MNLINRYMKGSIPAQNLKRGDKLIILERFDRGNNIPAGTIGTVIGSSPCDYKHCSSIQRHLCHGYLLSVKPDDLPFMRAHSCHFKFSTEEGIPVIFEEGIYEPN